MGEPQDKAVKGKHKVSTLSAMTKLHVLYYIRTSTVGLVGLVTAVVVRITEVLVRYAASIVARERVWWTGRRRSFTRNNLNSLILQRQFLLCDVLHATRHTRHRLYIQLYSLFGRIKIIYKHSKTGHIIKHTQNINMHAH